MIDTKLFKFIWKNKSHYIRKENICRSKIDGGLNVLDFKTSNTIFKIKWLQNYLKNKQSIWYTVPNFIFQKVGGIEFILKCDYDINKIPIKLANLKRELFGLNS